MAMSAIASDDIDRYLDLLRGDANELELLAKDLLINVTSFFRDPNAFDRLAETIVPELLRDRPSDQPIRIWIAGCSTGEEAYSLAMIFQEQITAARSDAKLQIFASDIDADAVARARDGLYPEAIEADVSPVTPCSVFLERRSRLQDRAGTARFGDLYRARCADRPAILPHRSDILPQSADLFAARRAGQGRLAVPFRTAGRRHSAARQF